MARQDSDSSVVLAVTQALLRLGVAALTATEALTATSVSAASREVRATAAEALRRMRTKEADSALLRPVAPSLAPSMPMPAR